MMKKVNKSALIAGVLQLFFCITIGFTQDEKEQNKYINDLISQIEQKIGSLELYLKKELSSLEKSTSLGANRISSQLTIINEEMKDIADQIEEIRAEFDNYKLKSDRATNEMADSILSLNKEFSDSLGDTREEILTIKKNSLLRFIILGTFLILSMLISGFIFKKRLNKTKFQEEITKLDIKLSELLSNQLSLMKMQTHGEDIPKNEAQQHDLAIRVGAEIFRMRNRISKMKDSTKGLNSLKNALTRLEDELNQIGYTIKDLEGEEYNEGLSLKIVTTIEDNNLKQNQRIINRMITPQVYFRGKLISPGEAEIAVFSDVKTKGE
jgi:uncharacterized protein (UPF0335 family)